MESKSNNNNNNNSTTNKSFESQQETDTSSSMHNENNQNETNDNEEKSNDQYFSGYNDFDVHELMIKDKPRTEAYLNAIKANKEQFKDKVLLDVGSGTGILSMFAAKYTEARQVYAVEASDMAEWSKLLVETNELEDRVKVFKGKIEEVELPEKVDIIMSEWMGFYLLHESMFESVLEARDKWLKTGGHMFPSRASIYVAPVCMDQFINEKYEFWTDVYGLDFSPLIYLSQQKRLQRPEFTIIEDPESQLLAKPEKIVAMDCLRLRAGSTLQGAIQTQPNFEITKNKEMHGFCVWFDVEFDILSSNDDQSMNEENSSSSSSSSMTATTTTTEINDSKKTEKESQDSSSSSSPSSSKIVLSSGPESPPTHWKQTVIMMPESASVFEGSKVYSEIIFESDAENPRFYNISAELQKLEHDSQYFGEHPADCDCAKCAVVKAFLQQSGEKNMGDVIDMTGGDDSSDDE